MSSSSQSKFPISGKWRWPESYSHVTLGVHYLHHIQNNFCSNSSGDMMSIKTLINSPWLQHSVLVWSAVCEELAKMVNQEPKIISLPITPRSPAGLHTKTFAFRRVGVGGLCIPWVKDVLQWLFKKITNMVISQLEHPCEVKDLNIDFP